MCNKINKSNKINNNSLLSNKSLQSNFRKIYNSSFSIYHNNKNKLYNIRNWLQKRNLNSVHYRTSKICFWIVQWWLMKSIESRWKKSKIWIMMKLFLRVIFLSSLWPLSIPLLNISLKNVSKELNLQMKNHGSWRTLFSKNQQTLWIKKILEKLPQRCSWFISISLIHWSKSNPRSIPRMNSSKLKTSLPIRIYFKQVP
jgi:hypothetical protein